MVKIDKKYKVVILDVVKTLVKEQLEWDKLREINAKIFKKHRITVQPQNLRPVIEQTASQLNYLKNLNFSSKKILQIEEDLLKAQEKFEKDSIKLFSLYEDTIPFLNYVNDHQLPAVNYRIEYDKSVISEARLEQYKQEEVAAKSTLVGPHRDDMIFLKNDIW